MIRIGSAEICWEVETKYTADIISRKRRFSEVVTKEIQFSDIGAEEIQLPKFYPIALSRKHAHPLDDSIRFVENTHTYSVRWENTDEYRSADILSVSGVVKGYFNEFDSESISNNIVKNRKHTKPGTKYYGMTANDIMVSWAKKGKIAAETGTKVHFIIECFYNGMIVEPYKKFKVIKQFMAWHEKNVVGKLIPFRSELRLRTDHRSKITGTADMLFVSHKQPIPDECESTLFLYMRDWKCSNGIKWENRWQQGKGPCEGMADCNGNKYTLQQNLYKDMLEHPRYGGFKYNGHMYKRTKVICMQLIVVHDTYSDAEVIQVPDTMHITGKIIRNREAYLSG